MIDTVRPLLLLALFLLCACVQADPTRMRFDIAAQPAAPALNEFARQADVTLIFSYDLVAQTRSRRLSGRYSVDDGLDHLLQGTGLSYRKSADGTYLVCRASSCEDTVHGRPIPTPAEQWRKWTDRPSPFHR